MVTSPNYPGNYPNNLEKKTEIIQVELGLVISLQFTAFDIHMSNGIIEYNLQLSIDVNIYDPDLTGTPGRPLRAMFPGDHYQ